MFLTVLRNRGFYLGESSGQKGKQNVWKAVLVISCIDSLNTFNGAKYLLPIMVSLMLLNLFNFFQKLIKLGTTKMLKMAMTLYWLT